ncbi:MAG: hypothetical protein Fues2KO_36140 [Fuerstiella sp.]
MSLIARTNSKSEPDRIDRLDARSLVRRIIDENPEAPLDATSLLDKYPQLKSYPSCIIDLAYEEFCRSREQGRNLRPSVFVRRFSGVEQSLFRVIEFDQVLQENPSLIEDVPEERWPAEGDVFCDFQLREQLGRGALSRVFRAIQPGLGNRQVVVKVCLQGQREADFMGKLDHPGIARVYSIHTDNDTGLAVICMPFVTRITLHDVSEWIAIERPKPNRTELLERVAQENGHPGTAQAANGPLGPEELETFAAVLTQWGSQLADALHYAHTLNVLHCDVKPGNVLVNSDLTVSLLDFNLAADATDAISLAGGTLPYMAPEQIRFLLNPEPGDTTDAGLSATTDVFGLCATLWHLATGEPPFGVAVDAKSRTAAAKRILKRQLQGLSAEAMLAARQVLPRKIVSVLARGLQATPALRYESADALARALRAQLPQIKLSRRTMVIGGVAAIAATTALFWPKKTLAEILQEGRLLIANREFDAATALLAEYPQYPECQFLKMVSRTCALPSMTTEYVLNKPQSHSTVNANRQWSEIADEWEAYAQTGSFSAEAYANYGLVSLEFGTPSAFRRAQDAFDRAREGGVQSAAIDRMRKLLAAWGNIDVPDELPTVLPQLHRLTPEILESGSRGELLTLLVSLRTLPPEEKIHPKFLEAGLAICDALDSAERLRGESELAGLLLGTSHAELTERASRINDRRTAPGGFNRLGPVMVLPETALASN